MASTEYRSASGWPALRTAGLAALVAGALLLAGCVGVVSQRQAAPEALRLKHLGSSTVPRSSDGLMANFGGISGMDRDPATDLWYLLSDDRSDRAAARIYTARIAVGASGTPSVAVTGIIDLLQPDGGRYRSAREGGRPPDPEALRFDPRTGSIFWSSEADRRLGLESFVRQTDLAGNFVGELPLPAMLRSNRAESGARTNLSLEGLAFTPDGSALWLGMEAPLLEDGPVPTLQSGAMARFTKVDRAGKVLAQYAYPLDPIPVAPTGGKLRADNGVSEILALDDGALLVLERAGYEVEELVFKFAVRIYEARIDGASDVSGMPALTPGRFKPMTKRLLMDLNASGLGDIDNLEAAAWGPCLSSGRASLLLASDDNFSPRQVNQFMLFEVTGAAAAARCP